MTVSSRFFDQELLKRILTSIILVPITLAFVVAGGTAFTILIVLASSLIIIEWTKLTSPRVSIIGLPMMVSVVASALIAYEFWQVQTAFVVILFGATCLLVFNKFLCINAKFAVVGILYVTVSGVALIILRNSSELGMAAILWLFCLVWVGDTAAFFFGKLIGGALLSPRISPNKTWAGAIASMLAASSVGLITAAYIGGTSLLALTLISSVIGMAAIFGDLAESWIKRVSGVKNASNLIPGHGGMMDRVDGLIFAVILAVIIGGSRTGMNEVAEGILVW
jgi:phosphatidate cytidylyltransferase